MVRAGRDDLARPSRLLRSADPMRLAPLLLAALSVAAAACADDVTAPPAHLVPTLPTVDFGRRAATAPPTVRAVGVQNTGGTASAPLSVALLGAGRVGFRVDSASSTCIDRRLAAASSCVVVVLLDGRASGPVSAGLLVGGAGDEDQRVTVALTGVIESKLAVDFQGVGHGAVYESVHDTSCNAECIMSFDVPTVTLRIVPDPVSRFVGWTGAPGCTTELTCTLTLIDLNAVTVEFEPLP